SSARVVALDAIISFTATLLADGRVLIAGGFVGGVTSLAGCDVYQPDVRRFVPTGQMAQSRFGHTASLLHDGRVLITGGSQFPGEITLRSAEIYDSATERFTAAGEMAEERARHTATVLDDGRVFITGGNSIEADGQLASTEIYDPATGRFTPGPPMCEPRMDHTATLLPDGRVLIAGGFNGVGTPHTLDSCEVYDPATGDFAPAESLPLPVHEHKATLLPGGRVLVTGGMIVADGERIAVTETAIIRP
ncbi:MAG: kelch repeat-containing protein, partial [Armatimonadota bacterium]